MTVSGSWPLVLPGVFIFGVSLLLAFGLIRGLHAATREVRAERETGVPAAVAARYQRLARGRPVPLAPNLAARFCSQCGAPLHGPYCSACGALVAGALQTEDDDEEERPAATVQEAGGWVLKGGIAVVTVAAITLGGYFVADGKTTPISCSVGAVGVDASLTVRGAGAQSVCSQLIQSGSFGTNMGGAVFALNRESTLPAICTVTPSGSFTSITVHDGGRLQLVGRALCLGMQEGQRQSAVSGG